MGFNFGVFLRIAEQVAPTVLAATGVPPALIPAVTHGIQLAEHLPAGTTGAEKKAYALDVAQTALTAVNAAKPGALDPAIVSVVDEGIDTVVGTINAITKKPISVS